MADQPRTPDGTDAAASVPASDADATPSPDAAEERMSVVDHIETVRVRRAPKYSVFLAAGAALGILFAMILTFVYNGTAATSPNTGLVYSQTQVFGFLALICITVGVALGGIVALILDRMLAKRSREVVVDRERIRIEE